MNIYIVSKTFKTGTTTKTRFIYAHSEKEAEVIYRDLCCEPDCKVQITKYDKAGMILSHRDYPNALRDQVYIWDFNG